MLNYGAYISTLTRSNLQKVCHTLHIIVLSYENVVLLWKNLAGYGHNTYKQSQFSDGYIGLSIDLAFHATKASRYGKSKYHRNSRNCHCYPW